ncbi:alpha/beta hydrolase [Pusillimonas sp.]|uniref:alpha/beta fold hydrolase n=1 Tax=Pusillimonas sp. TaxID=3040095 RepID=UPI0029A4CD42|nr:alpha/beta hydrolase [Pusillimonas sp.]MDX3894435.1 alpha/beta hydrolase [Pusillimonas sp.]
MNALPTWLASGRGGIPLIMLHGMGSTASIWLPQLEHFGRARLTVAWTMPGYRPEPAFAAPSWEGLAASLRAMLDALEIGRAHILGHSIGGMIAQEFYHRHPQRVQSLILSATSSAFGSTDAAWKEAFLRQRTDALQPYERFADAAPTLLDGFMNPATPSALRALAGLSASGIDKQRYFDIMRLLVTFDRRADFQRIDVPVLLLAGEHDTQAPPKGMQRLAQSGANARFQELPALRHMANIESPGTFNQAVDAFLAAQHQATES